MSMQQEFRAWSKAPKLYSRTRYQTIRLKSTLVTTFLLSVLLTTISASSQNGVFMVGYGKSDITYTKDNIALFGYGRYEHRISDSENGSSSDIYCRVVSIKDPATGKQVIYLHADLGGIFQPLRTGLVSKIKENLYPDFDEACLMMSASHTHCAPSGMSHYALYMMPTPGYNPTLVEFTVDKMYEAVKQSIDSQHRSTIAYKEGVFEPETPVAFNRALEAYNENPDAERVFERQETNMAINRTMTMLSFNNDSGTSEGFINWFGVHPIEVMEDHNMINGASKGYAALHAEETLPNNAVAIFAQSSAGDVMTTDYHNPKRFETEMRNVLDDPSYSHRKTSLIHSRWNGQVQADKALEIQNQKEEESVQGSIDYVLAYVDMSNVQVNKPYAHGNPNARTTSPCLGAAFLSPNFEWRDNSILRIMLNLLSGFSHPSEEQLPKRVIINGEAKSVIGLPFQSYQNKWLPTFIMDGIANVDLIIQEILRQQALGALEEHTILPKVLPLQIIKIGNVAIAGIPTEITTIAHNRLQATIQDALKEHGVDHILISSYANEYAGYTTTYEEYQVQRYEGGHTLFGKYQLGAFQTMFEKLAIDLIKPVEQRQLGYDVQPPVFSQEELDKRSNLVPLR